LQIGLLSEHEWWRRTGLLRRRDIEMQSISPSDGRYLWANALAVAAARSGFRSYEEGFRSFVDEVQAVAVRVGLETPVPRIEEAIRERNSKSSR
jgi:hypothetical protein